MKKKIIKFTLKFAISLLFIVLVIFKTDWGDFLYYVKKISFLSVLGYLAVLLLGMLISARKWQILAFFKGFDYPVQNFFKLYLAGTFINNFMPSFIAGDAYKAYEIAKETGRYSEAGSTVMMDRITGLIGAMILAVVFSILNLRFVINSSLLISLNILILLSLGFDIIIAKLKKWEWVRNWVKRILPKKVTRFIVDIYSYSDNRPLIRQSIILGIMFNIVGVAILNYILFLSLGVKIGILNYLSVVFVISIISALPITVNNIGLKEWSYITFFGLFGVSSGAAIAAAVVSRFLQMLVSFAALPVYLKSRK
jgi:glycosyltransferase 2 family protein